LRYHRRGFKATSIKKYAKVSQVIQECDEQLTENEQIDIAVECDELWSFVQKKKNKQWVWLALWREKRRVIGCFIGDRSAESAKKLWDSIPEKYKKGQFFTDFWEAYGKAIPKKQHTACGKETGETNHVERFNGTLRERVSRLVRKGYAHSKKLLNHIGAIFNW
jgi:IS1 family transposase